MGYKINAGSILLNESFLVLSFLSITIVSINVYFNSVSLFTLAIYFLSIIFCYLGLKNKRSESPSSKVIKTIKKDFFIISLLIIFQLFIFTYFASLPFHFHYDEFITAYTSYNLPSLDKINWFSVYPEKGVWINQFPILFHILQKPFFLIQTSTPMIRISVLPYILGTTLILYLFAKEIASKRLAILSTICFITLSSQIYIGSLGLHFHISTFVFILALYSFVLLKKYRKFIYGVVLGLSMAGSLMVYTSSYITFPLILFFMILSLIKKWDKNLFFLFLKTWGIFLITVLPFLIYAFAINNFFIQRIEQVNIFSGTWRSSEEIFKNASSFWQALSNHTVNSVKSLYIPGIGGMGEYWFGKQSFFEPMGLVLFLLGFIYIIYKLILRTSFYHFAILFIISLTFVSGIILTIHPPPFHRWTIAYPFLAIAIAYGIEMIIFLLGHFLKRRSVAFYTIVGLLIIYIFSNIDHTLKMVQQDSLINSNDIIKVTNYIQRNIKKGTPIYVAAFPANALGKEIFFRTKATYPIMTDYFPALKIKNKNSIIIVHRPSDESLREVFANYPDAKLISSVHLFDYAIIRL